MKAYMESEILYKYLNVGGGKAMLENHNIQFTNATKLNDPFDCIANLIDFSHIPDEEFEEHRRWTEDMYQTRYDNVRQATWLCSLSKVYDHLLMWSYYNQHKGICIGLNMEKLHPYLNSLPGLYIGYQKNEVQYKDTTEKPNYFNDDVDPSIYQICTKAKAWEHEQEVRLTLYQPWQLIKHYVPSECEAVTEEDGVKCYDYKDIRFIPPIGGECFESLYLGVRISKSAKTEFIQLARQLNPKIEIYQMETDCNKFKLIPKLLTETEIME